MSWLDLALPGTVCKVTRFCVGDDGNRNVGVDMGDVTVIVQAHKDSEETAEWIARAPGALREARDEIGRLKRKIDKLERQLPRPTPARLMNDGCVRQHKSDHALWLLSSQEKGWSAFGVKLRGWDELFREYDVEVVRYGSDEHGIYWIVRNRRETQS